MQQQQQFQFQASNLNQAIPNPPQPIMTNPKQLNRIQKRRDIRKALLEESLSASSSSKSESTEKQKFIYQSRHEHARKRNRSTTGKFSSSKKS